MDEDARWELALRQKVEADKQEEKRMQKELLKSGIARLKQLNEKLKKKKDKKKKSISKKSRKEKKSKKERKRSHSYSD